MPDKGQTTIERLQQIMTALMEHLLRESLQHVEEAIVEWRSGAAGVFDTHAELLKHAAKAERLAERMARIGLDNAGALLRDAFDAGLIGRDEFASFVGKQPEEIAPSPPLSGEHMVSGLPDKRDLVEELLGEGPILIHIDARHPLAQVPGQFLNDPKLVLRFGYDLTPAIVDLSVDEEGMYGTLTFGGVPTRCVLPWGSIYSVVSEADQKGMVWPDDVPECVVDALQEQGRAPSEDETSGATLESVEEQVPTPAPPARGGHLKLV